jgi:hypothetical protein
MRTVFQWLRINLNGAFVITVMSYVTGYELMALMIRQYTSLKRRYTSI